MMVMVVEIVEIVLVVVMIMMCEWYCSVSLRLFGV